MLYSSSLDEANLSRHKSEIWWSHSDTMWQHQCYKHIQEYSDVVQDKTYSYQVSFSMGTGHREERQVGVLLYPQQLPLGFDHIMGKL